MHAQTEAEELAAAAEEIGRKLEDIKVDDNSDDVRPPAFRYMATWGDYDLDCPIGLGATPQEAMWELINR